MKKTEKGMPGYLNYKRKIEIIRTHAYFGIVIAILLLGYFQTGTKLNLLTVVAIVGCLPASKALVGVITRFPYRSIDGERAKEIASKTDLLTVCYYNGYIRKYYVRISQCSQQALYDLCS